jgi:hypothetical protein
LAADALWWEKAGLVGHMNQLLAGVHWIYCLGQAALVEEEVR